MFYCKMRFIHFDSEWNARIPIANKTFNIAHVQ